MRRALLALALAGCGYTTEGPVVYDPNLVSALLVEAHLDPGATRVMDFREAYSSVPRDGFLLGEGVVLAHGAAADGTRLVNVVLATSRDRTVGNASYEAWFRVGADGRATRLARPEDAPPLAYDPRRPESARGAAGVDGVASAVVVECTRGHVTVFDLAGDALRARPGSRALCAGALGPSALPDRAVRLTAEGATFRVEALELGTGAVAAARALPRPVDHAVPLWAEEIADGRFLVLARDRDLTRLYAVEGDGPARSVALDGFALVAARRIGDRVLLTANDGGAAWWDEAGELTRLARTGDTLADVPWRFAGTPGAAFQLATGVNPETDLVSVPLAAAAQLPEADALRAGAAASTPCVGRTACRAFGESYLLAVFDAGPAPLGLYAFWSWSWELALYTAPVFRAEGAE